MHACMQERKKKGKEWKKEINKERKKEKEYIKENKYIRVSPFYADNLWFCQTPDLTKQSFKLLSFF